MGSVRDIFCRFFRQSDQGVEERGATESLCGTPNEPLQSYVKRVQSHILRRSLGKAGWKSGV